MTKTQILEYLSSKKEEFSTRYGITAIGLYGSYARDEAGENSDVDIFYDCDDRFNMNPPHNYCTFKISLNLE